MASLLLFIMAVMMSTSVVMGQRDPVVRTRLGAVRGTFENEVNQFRNIPFAKPPLGPLRFTRSIPADPWNGVRDATQFGPSCMQPPYPDTDRFLPNWNQSEDCLYLNVYVPGNVVAGSNKPVMVWVHGGAFLVGQAMLYDASFLASAGDVIVVTINYRLGIFGFLSTMDSTLSGNYGLWDQRLALQWVQYNIEFFGGNPRSVTLFGESAGAISVSLQTLNPLNNGLFQRVIAESGSSLSNAAVWQSATTFARAAGVILNCSSPTSKLDDDYARCMRSIPSARLSDTQNTILFFQYEKIGPVLLNNIGPVVDNILIPDIPYKLLSNTSSPSFKFFRTLGFMAGNVNQEGSLFLNRLYQIAKSKHFNLTAGVPTSIFFDYLAPIFTATFAAVSNRTVSSASVCSMYSKPDIASQANSVLDCFTDVNFVVPAVELLNIHSGRNILTSSYQYMFNRQSIDKFSLESLPTWFIGAPHASEVFFLFGAQEFKRKFNITVSSADLALSRRMLTHWTNFAKIGNPNMDNNPMWIPYDIRQKYYMDFNLDVTLKSDLFKDRMTLWLGSESDLISTALQSAIVGREIIFTVIRVLQEIHASNEINRIQKNAGGQTRPCTKRYWNIDHRLDQLKGIKMASLLLFIMAVMMSTSVVMGQRNPVVRTRLGAVRGTFENEVNQFRNIPFARPPLGPLRFTRSIPADPWNGVRDATQFGPSCMQPPYPDTDRFLPNWNQSEDCLYLNVYVPGNVVAGSNKPVMVWVHGGAFLVGQAMLYDASFLASAGDVIVVTINYRLGIFGFLSTMDSTLPGNYGLWDQRLALQWVQYNIEFFGGNPRSVTLFGESAGAMSVSLQTLNPLNNGLFQRVIAQSGSSLSNAAVWQSATTFARAAGVILNCSSPASKLDEDYARCMRSIPSARLSDTQNTILFFQSENIGPVLLNNIGPVVDNILIPDIPYKLLINTSSPSFKFFRTLGFMAGNVNQEGSLFLNTLYQIAKSKHFNLTAGVPTSIFCDYLAPIFTATFAAVSNRTVSSASVCSMYSKPDIASQANSVLDCFADVNFVVPAVELLNIHSGRNILTSSYQYMFNRQSIDKLSLESLPPWFIGAPHASEVFFLFGAQEFKRKFNITVSSADLALSRRMLIHWTNFAKIGNPNMDNNPMWIPYDIQQKY
ncbi:uncharacterized protein LOC117316264 [Pecten maximus]|uniref:uncharacterized protein LOC117316264 n=1 Tax=Pecten maximus TaxID=6579 RepID=UPI0014581FC3|nr:uncharacterized protein LOC117316264 [Pecten maximus]